MHTRPAVLDWKALVLVACAVLLHAPGIAAAKEVAVMERAQFIQSDAALPPADDAPWTDVSLPHDWRTLRARGRVRGWYRLEVSFDAVPTETQAVYLRHLRAYSVDLYVNGARHVGSRELHGPAAQDYGFPLHAIVPPSLWRPGVNVLHFRLYGSWYSRHLHGLGSVHLGPLSQTVKLWRLDFELTSGAVRYTFAATLTAGLITLLLWFARTTDRVMLWFAIACLSWAIANVPMLWLKEYAGHWIFDVTSMYVRFGMAVPAFVLALRFVDRRWPWLEAGLVLYLLAEVTYFLWSPLLPPVMANHWLLRVLWPTASALLLFAGAAIVARLAPRPLRWSHWLEMGALTAMGVLLLQDLARYLGWVGLEPPIVRPYHVPVMVLAIGAVIFERYATALARAERARTELEYRVAEKAREIENYHRRVEASKREQILAAERQRILADMHDGLGASLVALLRQVERGGSDAASLERRVREALQEMRIAIDALQPREGNLGNVLGSLRYRLDDSIRDAGITLAWQVGELPELENMLPSAAFEFQRILLEAITNALKHSRARKLSVSARGRGTQGVEVEIADNGQGFDTAKPGPGRGLASMRQRAARIGATLEIISSSGGGTTIRVVLPRQRPSAASQASTNPPLVSAVGATHA